MRVLKASLLQDLSQRIEQQGRQLAEIKALDLAILERRPKLGAWSCLECLEHLNIYGRFYLPEIKRAMAEARPQDQGAWFKSGWLGNYFARSVAPQEQGGMKAMKAFKAAVPPSELGWQVVQEFEQQLAQWPEILAKAQHLDLIKTKTAISLSAWIRLRLGDSLRVVLYHQDRHLAQAQRAITASLG